MVLRSTHILRTVDREAADADRAGVRAEGIRIVREARVVAARRERAARVHLVHAGGDEERARRRRAAGGGRPARRRSRRSSSRRRGSRRTSAASRWTPSCARPSPKCWPSGDALNRRLYTHVATYEGPIAAATRSPAAGERPRLRAASRRGVHRPRDRLDRPDRGGRREPATTSSSAPIRSRGSARRGRIGATRRASRGSWSTARAADRRRDDRRPPRRRPDARGADGDAADGTIAPIRARSTSTRRSRRA